jgi:hypothetical protein
MDDARRGGGCVTGSRAARPAKTRPGADTTVIPTFQGASANLGVSMYHNISSAFFYEGPNEGRFAMRPPF